MTITITNHSEHPFRGFVRAVTDTEPPQHARPIKYAGGYAVDVAVKLEPGASVALDPATLPEVAPWMTKVDPMTLFGGPLAVNGQAMEITKLSFQGAAAEVWARLRVGGYVIHAHVLHYSNDGHAVGELWAVFSDASTVAMVAAGGHRVTFGDSICVMPGAGFKSTVIEASDWLADGQGRAVPVVFVWPRLSPDLQSVAALADLRIGAFGRTADKFTAHRIKGFDAIGWAAGMHRESLRRLHTWDWSLIGPAAKSGVTGAQEEQGFTGDEPFDANGKAGVEVVCYANALKMLERPCHYLDAKGEQIDFETVSPRAILWDMRPHWHTGVSPYRHGKTRDLSYDSEAHGRAGADVEHWLIRRLAKTAGYRYSPALQFALRQHALSYLRQWTKEPGWSTSQPYASRGMAWEAQSMILIHENLDDRVLADRVVEHWRERMRTLTIPWIAGRKYWDIRVNDLRLGPGEWWMPWQQSVGAYWMDRAGEKFALGALREACLHGANAVVEEAWHEMPGASWQPRPIASVLGESRTDPSFTYYGMALAPAVLMRHGKVDDRTQRLWDYLVVSAKDDGQRKWLAPELLP